MSLAGNPVARFFLETHACGPGAVGEWRPGADLVREYAVWAKSAGTRDIRLGFYDEMRALGFAQKNADRVYFFVPTRPAPLAEHSRVKAICAIHEGGRGVPAGATGTIVRVLGDGYDVEFTSPLHVVISAFREELAPL